MRKDTAREIIAIINDVESEVRRVAARLGQTQDRVKRLEARLTSVRYRIAADVLGPNAPQTKAASDKAMTS